ncbi:hypothetical protein GCM10020221_23900 [Streptomyces thioluteus]|uniref:Uncharacterized protein n=1 Tax=Streptomyces thioluteus TaxID=66431 RepID=A0ABN3WWB7_STRTU
MDRSPNTAARVAARLGLGSPAVMDINVVCAGFTHALASADHAIRAGAARNALVIGVEKFTDVVDWTDRSTCVLVGDGAGAAVVTASAEPGIGPVVWGSVPEMGHAVRIEGTPSRFAQRASRSTAGPPPSCRRSPAGSASGPGRAGGTGRRSSSTRRTCASSSPSHGGSGAVNAVIATDVTESGNTSAASIPLALSKLVERRTVEPGAPVLLFGFGGNLSYGGQVIHCP